MNHYREVPYRLIHCDKDNSVGNPDAGNLLVQGDDLEALKALRPYYGQSEVHLNRPALQHGQ